MSNNSPVSLELHHEIEQFLFAEARLLDSHDLRAWLADMVDPEVRYQVVSYEERTRRDRRPSESGVLYINDDSYPVLDMRVKQFESGMQTMLDPLQRMRRMVCNVSAFHGEGEGAFRVFSNVSAMRFRRLYNTSSWSAGERMCCAAMRQASCALPRASSRSMSGCCATRTSCSSCNGRGEKGTIP